MDILKGKFSEIKIFFCLLFIGLNNCLLGQVITGSVTDSANVPVPYASVVLLKAVDSVLVKGSLCNDKGEYVFEKIESGKYLIKGYSVGYNEAYSNFFELDSLPLSIDNLMLLSTNINLNEVSVVAMRRTIDFKDGIIVMNVENSTLTSGNSVFDLLTKLPGVYVDAQNNIFLNGKSGVGILLDGRLQQMSGQQLVTILSSMSAETISKIEVMKTPPVKYDAAGSSGMINIVSKKVKISGISGKVSGSISKGHSYKGSTDASLNFKAQKITIFSSAGYAKRDFYDKYEFNKTISLGGNTTYLNENGERSNFQEAIYYTLGADYSINNKTTAGFLINGGPAATPSQETGINKVNGYNDLGFDHTLFTSDIVDNWSNPSYNINFEHRFDSLGTTLSIACDYSDYKGKRKAVSRNYFMDLQENEVLPANIYRSTHVSGIQIITAKMDFRKNIFKDILMETGAKGTFVESTNNYTFEQKNNQTNQYELNPGFSNEYIYRENVIAAYFNFRKEFKKISFQMGCRAENTMVVGTTKTSGFSLIRNYLDFFPKITFDYTKSEKHSFQLSLTKRIDRPGYSMLNPYKSYQDQYSSTVGNPYLTPQYTYNVELGHVFKKFIYNTFTYSHTTNFILSYDYQNDSTKETTSTIENLSKSDYYAYTLFFQKAIVNWWEITFSGSAFYQNYGGVLKGTQISRGALGSLVYINNDLIFPKSLYGQLSLQYVGPASSGVSETKSRWSLDLSVRKKFFKENLSFSIALLDIFHKDVLNLSSKFQNQNYTFIDIQDTQRVRVNISYKFGKLKIQKRFVNSNDQEKGRLENKLKN